MGTTRNSMRRRRRLHLQSLERRDLLAKLDGFGNGDIDAQGEVGSDDRHVAAGPVEVAGAETGTAFHTDTNRGLPTGNDTPAQGDFPELDQGAFPFTIQGDLFQRDGQPVFVNMINYSPLEPGQQIASAIREGRIDDDLRRLAAYAPESNDPLVLRVYPQPTAEIPIRMPQSFYDGVRDLGIWITRDIYFNDDFKSAEAINDGKAAIDMVINEVETVGGLDRIFAWEIGNEFKADTASDIASLENFLLEMRNHIKARMAESGRESFSDWVTWGSWSPSDPLRTAGNPIRVPLLDYVSFNAYSYEPDRIRDHQAGPVTGTPYAGYLAALKNEFPDKPMVVSESGLPDSPTEEVLDHSRISPLYPNYRKGGLSSEQVAEGLADRYWDARLAGNIAGFGVFEWMDEWHKAGAASSQEDHPEEYFGLGRFDDNSSGELRYKLQQQTIHDMYTMQFGAAGFSVGLTADETALTSTGTTTLRATVAPDTPGPVRYRWESSHGFVTGDADTVEFYAGGISLGPVTVTVVAIDANGRAATETLELDIASASPSIEILTFGTTRSSGRVANVDLTENKVVLYVKTDQFYVQPYTDMKHVWVGPTGHWWSENTVTVDHSPQLHAWVVPNTFDPPATMSSPPPVIIAEANPESQINDGDNDLLPDTTFEPHLDQDRYDDPDNDGATNLEELWNGGNPSVADNDIDVDGLEDTWERRYFGRLTFGPGDDPDNDGLTNLEEATRGIHPGRTAVDRDQDGLPDVWEQRYFTTLDQGGDDDANHDGMSNTDEYELGIVPDVGLDYGDAPGSFLATLLADDGPRHLLGAELFLGSGVDADDDGFGNGVEDLPFTSSDDDTEGATPDDEDGVANFAPLASSDTSYSVTVSLVNATGSDANLVGWIDFDSSGSFDADEAATAVVLNDSVEATLTWNNLGSSGPDIVAGATFARLRLTTDPITEAGTVGIRSDGEVEDYRLDIARVFVVNTLGDTDDANLADGLCADGTGTCSLRAAIEQANATPNAPAGHDRIHFRLPGPGPYTISPVSSLPSISDPVIIDGTTQPGFSGTPLVELDGSGAGAGVSGLTIVSGGSSVVGLAINRFASNGILLANGSGSIIQQNMIGTNADGTAVLGNGGHGVIIFNSAGNLVGGAMAHQANVISGNGGHGVFVTGAASTGNGVRGNMIGVGADGAVPLGNDGAGVRLDQGASENHVGGPGNVISSNSAAGIFLVGAGTSDNEVIGNMIGTDRSGTLVRGNDASGVVIDGAAGNMIGLVGQGNVISGNELDGVYVTGATASQNVIQSNRIGLDASGNTALPNQSNGINLFNAPNNTIGGATTGAGNVVSGNVQSGLFVFGAASAGNKVEGNRIGTDSTGTTALSNGLFGVVLREAPNNTVGGTVATARNVVSGNAEAGIAILNEGASGNVVIGNLIGTDLTGTHDVGNRTTGILIWKAPGNRVGGPTSAERNVISGNDQFGVRIATFMASGNQVLGNLIGTDISGAKALPNNDTGIHLANAQNTIVGGAMAGAGNVVSANGNHGIVLTGAGAANNRLEGNVIGLDLTGTVALGNANVGVRIAAAAHDNTVGGVPIGSGNLISANGADGVLLVGANTKQNTVAGNLIGTDLAGTVDLGNASSGVAIVAATTNTVGGAGLDASNLISGNDLFGVAISGATATGNVVQGNAIGTDITGSVNLGNASSGVFVAAPDNRVGGVELGAGNLISGNGFVGLRISGPDANGNRIEGNLIGTQIDGATPLGNAGQGVRIDGASNNHIGGTATNAGNVIAHQTRQGVAVIGASSGNSIQGNAIFANGELGIDLNLDGRTHNDTSLGDEDNDSGPNQLQNFPVLQGATLNGSLVIDYAVPSTPDNSAYDLTIEFFLADSSGAAGQAYLGRDTYTVDDATLLKRATITAGGANPGDRIVATATDALGNTSEFSAEIMILASPPLDSPTAGTTHWQNPLVPRDVNNDGSAVDPVGDILPLINELHQRTVIDGHGILPAIIGAPPIYLDINGDGRLTPVGDVLPQINAFNTQVVREGEGRPGGQRPTIDRRLVASTHDSPERSQVEVLPRGMTLPVEVDVDRRAGLRYAPRIDSTSRNPIEALPVDHLFRQEDATWLPGESELESLVQELLGTTE